MIQWKPRKGQNQSASVLLRQHPISGTREINIYIFNSLRHLLDTITGSLNDSTYPEKELKQLLSSRRMKVQKMLQEIELNSRFLSN